MKYRVAAILLGAVFCLKSALFAATDPKLQDTVNKSRQSVVSVIGYDASGKKLTQGSGFIVSGDGTVITCWHNLTGAAKVKIIQRNGEGQ